MSRNAITVVLRLVMIFKLRKMTSHLQQEILRTIAYRNPYITRRSVGWLEATIKTR